MLALLSPVFVALKLDEIIRIPYLPPTVPGIFSFSVWTLKSTLALVFYTIDGETVIPPNFFRLSGIRDRNNQKRTIASSQIKLSLFRYSSYLSSLVLFHMRDSFPKWAFLTPIIILFVKSATEVNLNTFNS